MRNLTVARAVAWRTLHNVFTNKALVIPQLAFPLFFFAALPPRGFGSGYSIVGASVFTCFESGNIPSFFRSTADRATHCRARRRRAGRLPS